MRSSCRRAHAIRRAARAGPPSHRTWPCRPSPRRRIRRQPANSAMPTPHPAIPPRCRRHASPQALPKRGVARARPRRAGISPASMSRRTTSAAAAPTRTTARANIRAATHQRSPAYGRTSNAQPSGDAHDRCRSGLRPSAIRPASPMARSTSAAPNTATEVPIAVRECWKTWANSAPTPANVQPTRVRTSPKATQPGSRQAEGEHDQRGDGAEDEIGSAHHDHGRRQPPVPAHPGRGDELGASGLLVGARVTDDQQQAAERHAEHDDGERLGDGDAAFGGQSVERSAEGRRGGAVADVGGVLLSLSQGLLVADDTGHQGDQDAERQQRPDDEPDAVPAQRHARERAAAGEPRGAADGRRAGGR